MRGLRGNFDELIQLIHISERKPDIISLCEAFLNDDVLDDVISIDGFVSYRRDRCQSNFGGIAVYIKEDMSFVRRSDLEHKDYEVVWMESVSKSPKLHLISVYRPPKDDDSVLTYLGSKLNRLKINENVIIVGDFNAKHSEWYADGLIDSHGRELLNFANTNGLFQLVKDATRRSTKGKTSQLDFVFTDIADCKPTAVVAPIGNSDHDLLQTCFSLSVGDPKCSINRHFWQYDNAEWEDMRSYLKVFDFSPLLGADDINVCWENWKAAVTQVCAMFIPFRTGTYKTKKNPWFSKECDAAISEKKEAHKRLKYCTDSYENDFTVFTEKRNKAVQVCRDAKRAYKELTGDRLKADGTSNNKQWSKLVKLATGTIKQPRIPTLVKDDTLVSDALGKAQVFNEMFSSVSQIDDKGVSPPKLRSADGNSLMCVKFRHKDVTDRLRKLDVSKSTGPDGISARVLKECARELAPSLSKLFSLSFKTGNLPQEWKSSNVCPVYKKGSKSSPENYRPISLLCIVSKVMEGIINRKLRNFLVNNNRIHDHQFGFRPKNSALDALTLAVQKWEDALDKQKEVRLISLDISKAFDKVWHPGLIEKLQAAGISGRLLDWLKSFISGRSQRVIIDGSESCPLSIGAGVPQGSILGPTLFLLFINDLKLTLKNEVIMFADDTTLFSIVDSKDDRGNVAKSLNEDLVQVERWAKKWFVTFNASKTQSLIISRHKDRDYHPPLSFLNSQVEDVDDIKFLGLTINRKLNWSNHIMSLSKQAGRRTGLLKKASHVLPQSLLTRYYKQSVRSIMEQYSPIWCGSSQRDLHLLDSIQKKCVHLCGISKENLLKERVQSLSHRRSVAGISTFYKLQRGLAPSALQSIKPDPFISCRSTRHSTSMMDRGVRIPRSRTTQHQQSYIPLFSRRWNDLPVNLTAVNTKHSLLSFKKSVNKHFLHSSGD